MQHIVSVTHVYRYRYTLLHIYLCATGTSEIVSVVLVSHHSTSEEAEVTSCTPGPVQAPYQQPVCCWQH